MAKPVIQIPLPQYLLEWYLYNNGGKMPIVPKRNSQIAMILTAHVTHKPAGWEYKRKKEGNIWFPVPHIHGKWAGAWCYLPHEHVKRIQQIIRAQFYDVLFLTLGKYMSKTKDEVNMTELIYKFMSKNHIEDTEKNFVTIKQIYFRMKRSCKMRIDS